MTSEQINLFIFYLHKTDQIMTENVNNFNWTDLECKKLQINFIQYLHSKTVQHW